MKSLSKLILVITFALLCNVNVNSQNTKLKIGHINSSELMSYMPGRDTAQKALMDFAKELEEQLQLMTKEFETKYQDYLANEARFTEIVKKSKQKELTDLQSRVMEFQESAQDELQNKEVELLRPLLKRAQDAIQAVAKEKGYTYILDTSTGTVLYFEDSDDVLSLVKKKLGIE